LKEPGSYHYVFSISVFPVISKGLLTTYPALLIRIIYLVYPAGIALIINPGDLLFPLCQGQLGIFCPSWMITGFLQFSQSILILETAQTSQTWREIFCGLKPIPLLAPLLRKQIEINLIE